MELRLPKVSKTLMGNTLKQSTYSAVKKEAVLRELALQGIKNHSVVGKWIKMNLMIVLVGPKKWTEMIFKRSFQGSTRMRVVSMVCRSPKQLRWECQYYRKQKKKEAKRGR
jgi:hypothetical protein